ncbi:MAG: deoxyribodipyrimidine photolyase [Gemmatimonadota bacterium]|nr:deoxyribodipyrimidine photolyase [Gemmatimonadota bacterium]
MTTEESPRVRVLRDLPEASERAYVLYWMTANRRLGWNFALDRAVEWAHALGKPLVILEALAAGYRWASDRHHAFVLHGMEEHRRHLAESPVAYHPYVEPAPGEGQGLLVALAEHACVVVADDAPVFFLPRILESAAQRVSTRLEAVDSCGLLPMSRVDRPFSSAYHFRRFLHRTLAPYLTDLPDPAPLSTAELEGGSVPDTVRSRWPEAPRELLAGSAQTLARLPIDHEVTPSPIRGGTSAARARLDQFLARDLDRYGEERNHPDSDASSRLSPWLHFGHMSVHEVFHRVAAREGWSPARLATDATGKREGWWGMGASAEAFLDELVTWRELGFGFCRVVSDYDQYETLPEWARATLEDHASDPRPWTYSLEAFARAETHDELWNAAQRQLLGEGIMHNYVRMLWGKKILEWSASPREALRIMVELNNRYALDGRDPNSYNGIMWVLGRFDRGWPERAVYGKVRSMSSERTRRKVSLDRYLERWGGQAALDLNG